VSSPRPLTGKQQRFIDEYLIDLNSTQAARRAGYSPKTAAKIGSENLQKPDVQREIARRKQETAGVAGVTRERVLAELAAIAFSDVRELYDESGRLRPIKDLDAQVAASIAGIEVEETWEEGAKDKPPLYTTTRKIKRWDKNKALEMLGKHLGLWIERDPPKDFGPGLTVIIQSGPNNETKVLSGRVPVTLPGPG
jgi:phage terminase small subunit